MKRSDINMATRTTTGIASLSGVNPVSQYLSGYTLPNTLYFEEEGTRPLKDEFPGKSISSIGKRNATCPKRAEPLNRIVGSIEPCSGAATRPDAGPSKSIPACRVADDRIVANALSSRRARRRVSGRALREPGFCAPLVLGDPQPRTKDDDDWAQVARMRIVGRGYKAGRFTYVGNAALPPPPD